VQYETVCSQNRDFPLHKAAGFGCGIRRMHISKPRGITTPPRMDDDGNCDGMAHSLPDLQALWWAETGAL
jgi:hypothetical protein